ncbi:GWxTD domain-containing protein [candidate division KSB1 bacterium]
MTGLTKKLSTRFIAVAAVVMLLPAFLSAQDVESLLRQARELKAKGSIDLAISTVEEAIKKDKSSAEAHYELGLLQQVKLTAVSLKRAELALLTALRLSPDNPKYIAALASVYADRYMYSAARTMWNRIVDRDSLKVEALNSIADSKAKELERNRFRIDPYLPNQVNAEELSLLYRLSIDHFFYDLNMLEYDELDYDEESFLVTPVNFRIAKEVIFNAPIEWSTFTAKDEAEVANDFLIVLSLEPDNREALRQLGIIYYNKVEYQRASDNEKLFDGYRRDEAYLDSCVYYFQKMIDSNPDDKEGHQFLGLAYFRKSDFEHAYDHFMTAKSLMSADEKAVFTNIGLLKVGGLQEERIFSADEDTAQFWYRRDPLYLTPYNERELEHYSRVSEANLWFTNRRRGIEGWRTDQGRTLIKYGPPQNRLRYRSSGFGPDEKDREFWHYDNFAFVFEKPWSTVEKNYEFAIWRSLNFLEIAPRIEEEYPEYYKIEPKGSFIEFHYDALDFRGRAGYTKVEFIYGVPFNKLRFRLEEEEWYGQFKSGLFVFDEAWKNALTDTVTNELRYEAAMIDTASDDMAVDSKTFFFDPGEYTLNIEIMDRMSDNLGSYRDALVVEEYGYDTLLISDIQLALDIELLRPDQPIHRDNLTIKPTPHRFYRVGQPIFIYYEVYNIVLDETTNRSDFTVEYTMHRLTEDRSAMQDFVKLLTLNLRQEIGVATMFRFQGNEYEESQFLKIDHNITEPGPYELTLSVTDNTSGEVCEKSTILFIFEDRE